jgi:16S rRNA (cytosine967-C5)-methyltransferase
VPSPPRTAIVPTARTVAALVLVRVWKDAAFAAAALDAETSRAVQLEPRDRALATELVYGSLRVLPWLEERIVGHAPRGLSGLDPRTRAEMVLSAYQLFFLDRVPAFAAVNEAVEAVKRARGTKLASFANAVLRKVSNEATALKEPGLFGRAVYASLPPWLSLALGKSLGDEGARAFSLAGAEPPPLGLRVCRAGERTEWLTRLSEAAPHGTFEAGKVSPLAILARSAGKPEGWPGFGEAWSVQEEGSQLVALAVGARAGETVLDACAGRGNKSMVLAAAIGPQGALDAADLHAAKLHRLRTELSRQGFPLRSTFAIDWSVGVGESASGYDRALVDAPCSGVGTLRRRPDLTLRREPEDLARLAELQSTILLRVARQVRRGGRLVYAVCSVLTEECENVVARAVAGGLTLAPFDSDVARSHAGESASFRLLPHVHGTDGYFLASFIKET